MFIIDKLVVLILRDLMTGIRFNKLMKSITGVSKKVLTEMLRRMKENELVIREVLPEVSPRVEYFFTNLCRSLSPILDTMKNWDNDYKKLFSES